MKEKAASSSASRKQRNGLWIGGVVAVLLGWVVLFQLFGDNLTRLSFDLPLLFKSYVTPDEVVIVYQDDESHEQMHQPYDAPWDRKVHAQLLRRLKADSSRAVIFDLVMDSPSTNAQDDAVFAAAIREHGRVVLAEDYKVAGENSIASGLTSQRPIPILDTNCAATGMPQVFQDVDAVVRSLVVGRGHGQGGDYISTFTWKAAELEGAPVTKNPATRDQYRWLNYYGPPGTIASVSYYRALGSASNSVPPGFFRNKVVLVGVLPQIGFTGAGKDTFSSPYLTGKPQFAGVEIHATVLANLLRSEWLRRSPVFDALLLALTGLTLGYGLVRFRPLWATVAAVVAALGLGAAACLAMWHLHWWTPWLIVVAIQIPVTWAWAVLFHWFQSQLDKQYLEQSLSMYLSPKLVKQFARDKDRTLLKPGANKQKLTIIFSDIAGFTSISEGMDSDELAAMMNEYFEGAVGSCIHPTDGTVVKYIGDAIFAFWNAPEPQPDHALRACDAALRFREMSKAEVRGKRLITRIGLHTGVANVGNFGSATRVDYTAIGEDINLAARMEGLNKYLGTSVLLTGAVKQEIGDRFVTQYLGRFQLKGFEASVEVYELVSQGTTGAAPSPLDLTFAEGVRQFQSRDFDGAKKSFQGALELQADYGPAKFYLHVVDDYRTEAPPPDWAGEVELKDK